MRSEVAVALKKSRVFWISSSTLSVTASMTGRTSSALIPSTTCPSLANSGAGERYAELVLNGLGIAVAAHGNVAGEQ